WETRQAGRVADDAKRRSGEPPGERVHVLDDDLADVPAKGPECLPTGGERLGDEPQQYALTRRGLERELRTPGERRRVPVASERFGHESALHDPVAQPVCVRS